MPYFRNLDSTYARVAFNFITTAAFTLLALAAAACYQAHIRKRLLKGDSLRIVYAIGWLRGSDVLTAWRKTGQTPGGLWYSVMLFITLAGYTAHQLNSAIVEQYNYSECPFTTGLVLKDQGILIYPTWNTLAYSWTQYAQTHATDGCATGILSKIPSTAQSSLCPQTKDIPLGNTRSDVLGTWACTSAANTTYPPGLSDIQVADKAVNASLLYNGYHTYRWARPGNGTNKQDYNQIIVWSASMNGANATGHQWDVKFGLEVDGTWQTQTPSDFRFYTCSLYPSKADTTNLLQTIAKTINTTRALDTWVSALPGYLYQGSASNARNDAGPQMSYILNSMFMIAGGRDDLNATLAAGQDKSYGCTGTGTYVPMFIVAFLGMTLGLVVFFSLWWIVLKIEIARLSKIHPKKLRLLPTDQCDWAARAAYASERVALLSSKTQASGPGGSAHNLDDHASEEDSMFGDTRALQKKDWTKDHLQGRRMRAEAGHIVIYKEGGIQDSAVGHGPITYNAHPNKPM